MKGLNCNWNFLCHLRSFSIAWCSMTYAPLAFGWNIVGHAFPNCGFVYYLINAIIALIGTVVYTCVARQYQYWERDESDNVYRYMLKTTMPMLKMNPTMTMIITIILMSTLSITKIEVLHNQCIYMHVELLCRWTTNGSPLTFLKIVLVLHCS